MKNSSLAYRLALPIDEPRIWEILKGEIEVMRKAGRNQWQNGYPNPDVVAADIRSCLGMVLLQEGTVVGYCALICTGDPCYDVITDGEWITDSDSSDCRYSVVHRIGIDPALTGQGLAKAFIGMLLAESRLRGLDSMRIDTNFDNEQMLHILPQMGFTRCGMVTVADGPRIAFERLL